MSSHSTPEQVPDASPQASDVPVDVVILGGGVAGLWLLDALHRAQYSVVLLEPYALGHGQTITAQGIIHGGVKYAITGKAVAAARAIREMPAIWRACLAGEAEPDLRATRRRADFCYLWRTKSLLSRLGMAGARAGLRITPRVLDVHERPDVLGEVPGQIARLEEQVIEPPSLLTALADRHLPRLLKIDWEHGIEMRTSEPGCVDRILLINPESGEDLALQPTSVVLTAGAGNDTLRAMLGLDRALGQRRPLHMVMVRGDLPVLNGHCVDGNRTRITVTSTVDHANRTVWQIGGQIAELGVELEPDELIRRAHREVSEVIPGIDLSRAEWSTYRVDRAEARAHGSRPDDAFAQRDGDTITAWPTKLALAPTLVEQIMSMLEPPRPDAIAYDAGRHWPRPTVAIPPWETSTPWFAVD